MIADSPYQVGEPIMKAWQGVLAGLVSSLLMLLLVVIIEPLTGVRLDSMLRIIGSVIISTESGSTGQSIVNAGFVLHIAIGAIMGLLYALSQNQVPVRGVIGVAVFYGVLLWIVGSVFIGAFFGETLRVAVRSFAWFLACLFYGLSLGLLGVWILKRKPAARTITVLD